MKTSSALFPWMAAAILAGHASGAAAAAPTKVTDGIITSPAGMTLYTFDRDTAGKSACTGSCASNWPPLMAQAGDQPEGDYTIIARDDGKKQWAYKGKPLYQWSKDRKPGDKSGDGVNNLWHAAKP